MDMTMIRNADGTVGNIISANKFLGDTNLISKYNLLQSYSGQVNRKRVLAGGTDGTGKTEDFDILSPTLSGFMTKLQNFQFCPPSDNLWTVNIDSEGTDFTDGSSLITLYNSIISTNQNWEQMVGTGWKIILPKKQDYSEKYIQDFLGVQGIFLAQDVNFPPLQTQINQNFFTGGQQHGSFYNFGNVSMSRQNNRNLNISFLISNWDIGDILFDPWIAAVAQKGLIEDGNSTIKAKITISEYSQSVPKEYNNNISSLQMKIRKQYIFRNCVPTRRGEVSKNYNVNEAGTFKKSIVNFIFDDYKIIYNF